jgi:hypothetical protein
MKSIVETAWRGLMDEKVNPLKHLPLTTSHLILQSLAWMWSAIFAFALGSYFAFGISASGHMLFLAGIFATISVFKKNSRARAQRDLEKRLGHIWKDISPV